MSKVRPPSQRRILYPRLLIFTICLGLFDGADLASLGVTLSRISHEFGINTAQAGICAAASMIGLSLGAICAGRAADLLGRRAVLAGFTVLLGIFALGTTVAWNFESLLAARFLTGLGMGGVMPILLAMSADSAAPGARSTAVSALMASGAFGSILASIVSLAPEWRYVFYFGGLGPLLLLPIILFWMPEASRDLPTDGAQQSMSFSAAMFGEGRRTGTLLIWAIAFCTTLVSYILINWLPSLLVRQGFGETQSHATMIAYSIGGIAGNLAAGVATDRGGIRFTYGTTYFGAMLCILGLSTVGLGIGGVYALALGTNFCLLGAQLVTLALAPIFYPRQVQATGLGAMVSAGRIGSIVGPFAVGQLLHAGLTANQVLVALIPALLVPMALSMWLGTLVRRTPVSRDVAVSVLATAIH